MLLAGRFLDAHEAPAARLPNEVVASDKLLAAGQRLADRFARSSALAMRLTKAVFHAPRDGHPFIDDVAQAVLFETEEKTEPMTKLLERNDRRSCPKWSACTAEAGWAPGSPIPS